MNHSQSPPAIRVENLTKRYGAFCAVDHISFSISQGSATALLGGNGAGKTTTLSMLLGILTPSAGTIEVLGHAIPRERYLALAKMNLSSPYVDLPYNLTARQNLRVYSGLYGIRNPAARIEELAHALDLDKLLDRRYGNLSSGQKTRVSLAKALLNRPQALLLDEPTASLDPDIADRIRGYLDAYRKETGAVMLLASHNMLEVERMCDMVLMMRDGRIVDRGTPADLINRHDRTTLEQVFLHLARAKPEDTETA